jgi:uroporphyrinogen-III synthase
LPPPGVDTLAGFTVAVTADRRRDDLTALLTGRGARVVMAPALRAVPLAGDAQLRAATQAVLDRWPDVIIAMTGIGLRGWVEAADGWGWGDALRSRLDRAYLVTSGPKASGLIRQAGLREHWAPGDEDSREILDHLRWRGITGRTVAVQLHGEPQAELCERLRAAGADVIEVTVHRWAAPSDPAPLRRLVDLVAGRLVDAVAFTSAPAAHALLRAAGDDRDAVLDALRRDVLVACTGPITAAPLRRYGVPVVAPSPTSVGGVGALVRAIAHELPPRARTVRVAGKELTLRGYAAIVEGELRPMAPAPMAVLRALARVPGRVLARRALLAELPRGADEHAVEMAVARLRAGLGDSSLVQTVVKRGYRLAVDT